MCSDLSMTGSKSSSPRWLASLVGGLTGLLGLGVIQYRRRNKRSAAASLRAAVSPTHTDPEVEIDAAATVAEDEAHAPGHRHLGPPPKVRRTGRTVVPMRHADKIGHPARFG